jgi:hypothetical protein
LRQIDRLPVQIQTNPEEYRPDDNKIKRTITTKIWIIAIEIWEIGQQSFNLFHLYSCEQKDDQKSCSAHSCCAKQRCNSVAQQCCNSSMHQALLLFFCTTHTMLKNAECSYCSSAVYYCCVLRAAQHKWHTYGVARMRVPERE